MPNDEKTVHGFTQDAAKAIVAEAAKVGWLQLFYALGHLMQPAIVLTICSRIDRALKEALLSKMRPINSDEKERLFDGYGPLSTFSAKLDMAYSLSVFDKQIYFDLKVIKEIRNKFAHPPSVTELTNFAADPILSICKKFKNYNQNEHPLAVFGERIAHCLLPISKNAEDIDMANKMLEGYKQYQINMLAVERSKAVPAPLPDKSS